MYYFYQAKKRSDREDAFRLRYQIYCVEKGWFIGEKYEDNLEYDDFDEISEIFVAKNSGRGVIGTARLIPHTPSASLQIAQHPSAKEVENFANCAEISRLVTDVEHRNGPVALGLIRIIFRRALKYSGSLRFLYIGVDVKFHRILRRLGFDFRSVGKVADFYGDPLLVARLDIAEMDDAIKKRNPEFHNWLHQDASFIKETPSFARFRN